MIKSGIETLKADKDSWGVTADRLRWQGSAASYAAGVHDGIELAIATLEDLLDEGDTEQGEVVS